MAPLGGTVWRLGQGDRLRLYAANFSAISISSVSCRRRSSVGVAGCAIRRENAHRPVLSASLFMNRPGFAGGSNFQIGWSHDEQNDEQVFP